MSFIFIICLIVKFLIGLGPKAIVVGMIKRIYSVFWLVLLGAGLICGQEKVSKQEIIRKLKDGLYTETYPLLEAQYRKFPKDPDYIYYTGMCRVQVSENIPGAIDLLNEATQLNTYKESWFYLGRAYLLNYQFEEAAGAFSRFNDKAGRDEKDKLKLSLYQSMNRSALDICTKYKKITVVKVDTMAVEKLTGFLNKQKIHGKLETFGEISMFSSKELTGVKFTSTDNNFVFMSKFPFGKKQKDIFISTDEEVELGKSKTIGSPVNSIEDENFIFYDPTAPAIYFSSQGHNSAGGYDIFRSYYDKKSQKWSNPENLGFPINTPFDEIAYITIPGTNRSLLASKRNTRAGYVVVYTLENVNDSEAEPIISFDAKGLSLLKPGKALITQKNTPVKSSKDIPLELKDEKSYQKLIHDALTLQIRSDSIRRLGDEKKEMLISAKTESEKTRLWQEIKSLDERADVIQQKADVLYKKAREVEMEKQALTHENTVNSKELAQKAFNKKGESRLGSSANTSGKSKEENDMFSIEYRIQIGIFSKKLPDEKLKGFDHILQEVVNNGVATKYYVGLYKKNSDAEKWLAKVRKMGFKDAYVIGYYNGKIVPLSRAKELELSLK